MSEIEWYLDVIYRFLHKYWITTTNINRKEIWHCNRVCTELSERLTLEDEGKFTGRWSTFLLIVCAEYSEGPTPHNFISGISLLLYQFEKKMFN